MLHLVHLVLISLHYMPVRCFALSWCAVQVIPQVLDLVGPYFVLVLEMSAMSAKARASSEVTFL